MIKMFSQSMQDSEESSVEIEEDTLFSSKLKEGTTKLRFESEEDFVFSYSFIDNYDEQVNSNEKWEEEREEIYDLTTNIEKKKNSILYALSFKANYRNSSTRYIIAIAPENEKYTIETLENPCIITKLVTEKSDEVKIINIADVGENEFINVDIDLNSLPESNNNKYIIGIISQELRFGKKLNFYDPIEFIGEMIEPTEINKTEINVFDLYNEEVYFSLSVDDKSEYSEMLLLHYKLEQKENLIIGICGPSGNTELFEINDDEGFINFLYDKNGTYTIGFKKKESESLGNLRRATEDSIKVRFELFTTETPFDLDLKNNNIEFKEFYIANANEPSLKFNIMKLDKDYTKKISISNYDFSNIHEIVSINENNLGYKELNFTYYTFEKNSNYNVTIKFRSKGGNSYTLEKVNILDYPSIEYKSLEPGNFIYDDINDKFYFIDWKNIDKIIITINSQNPKLLLSEKSNIANNRSENLLKEFKNLKFIKINNLTLTKPENSDYSILMIEPEIGTKLNVEFIKKKDDKKDEDDDDDDDNDVVIILVIVFSCVAFIIILIFIIRCIRKRQENIDFKKKTEDIQQETLLKEF